MSSPTRDSAAAQPATQQLDTLINTLDSEEFTSNDFDRQNWSRTSIRDYLETRGIPEHEPLQAYGLDSSDIAQLDGGLAPTPLVPRPALLRKLREAVDQYPAILVVGAVRSGKSHLVNQLLSDAETRDTYGKCVVLDGIALRGRSVQSLNRQAIAYLCADDNERSRYLTPEGCHVFAPLRQEATPDSSSADETDSMQPSEDCEKEPLVRYFRSGAIDGGILVLEHAERITPGPEGTYWIEVLLREVAARAARMIVVYATVDIDGMPHSKHLSALHSIRVPDLTQEEIAFELAHHRYAIHRRAGMTAELVYRVTGGRPGLVRDLFRFLESECTAGPVGRRAVISYARRESREYSVECEYLLKILKCRPDVLIAPLRAVPNRLLKLAAHAGAVVESGGRYRFASPILAARYALLTRPRTLVWMMAEGELETVLCRAKYPEVMAFALNGILRAEELPIVVFSRFAQILRHLGVADVRIHLRDRDNARLWSTPLEGGETTTPKRPRLTKPPRTRGNQQPWPLDANKEPEFARTVRICRRVIGGNRVIWLPSVGTKGRVEVLATGRIDEDFNSYAGRLKVRTLWNLVLALEPALSAAAERLALRRQLRMSEDALYRLKVINPREQPGLLSILKQAACSAVLVLERGDSGWHIAQHVDTKSEPDRPQQKDWSFLLDSNETQRLDAIVHHPSRRSLVLAGDDLGRVFPKLLWRVRDVAVSLHPVRPVDTLPRRLIAFVFEGAASQHINGARQKQLESMVSRNGGLIGEKVCG